MFIESIDESVDILEPVNDGEEFIIKHIGNFNREFTKCPDSSCAVGRYYGDVYPLFKNTLYKYLKKALNDGGVLKLHVDIFHRGKHEGCIDTRIFYENEEIMILYDFNNTQNNNKDYIYSFKENNVIEEYMDIQSDNYVVSYDATEGTYNWSKKMYDLLEIEKSEGDSKRNIIENFIFKDDLELLRKKYGEVTPTNPELEYNFRIRTFNNNVKYINCSAFAVYDNYNNLQKIFYFFKDITNDMILSKNLDVLRSNLDILQRLSKSAFFFKDADGNYKWTSNICNILECGDSSIATDGNVIEELVIEDDKESFRQFVKGLNFENPTANFKSRILTRMGNLKYLNIFLRNNYNSKGELKSVNMYVYDITNIETIQSDKNNLLNAFNSIDYNLKTGIIYEDSLGKLKVSKMFYNIIGVYKNWECGGRESFVNNIINKQTYLDKFEALMNNEVDEIHLLLYYRFDGYDDDIRIFEYFLRRNNGVLGGYIRDISQTKDNEMELKKLSNQKSMLIKEIHHRVKNNLQVLSSLLNLEERFYRNDPDKIIDATKKRINSMALIHELTYNSSTLETVNLKKYFNIYDSEMGTIFNRNEIVMDNQIEENIDLHIKTVTPLILIVNEFTSNSIKYAFDYKDDKNHVISKIIRVKDNNCILDYKDNGVGLPEGYDIYNSTGLGWTIINSLVNQLNGNMEEIESEGIGFRITFPLEQDKMILEENL